MTQPRRKCRLADSKHKDVDLRKYSQVIIDTINETVPGKNPRIFESYFSTDPLTQSEAVLLGRSLSKINALKGFGKTITTFRLFDGRTCESESSNTPIKATAKDKPQPKIKPIGGRVK